MCCWHKKSQLFNNYSLFIHHCLIMLASQIFCPTSWNKTLVSYCFFTQITRIWNLISSRNHDWRDVECTDSICPSRGGSVGCPGGSWQAGSWNVTWRNLQGQSQPQKEGLSDSFVVLLQDIYKLHEILLKKHQTFCNKTLLDMIIWFCHTGQFLI